MAGPLPHSVYRRRRAAVTAAVIGVVVGLAVLVGSGGTDTAETGAARDDQTSPPSPDDEVADPDGDATTTTTWRSTGRFHTAPGGSEVVGTGPITRYTVEAEEGSGGEVEEFAAEVDEILADPRGWTALEGIGLERVSDGEEADFTVRLSSPDTVDVLCAPLETAGDVSCAQDGMAVINTMRWHRGAEPSGLGLDDYRRYLVSHEVGHLLGHGHAECPGPGQPAPVMMQQTLTIGDCAPNPWPDPHAAVDNESAGG